MSAPTAAVHEPQSDIKCNLLSKIDGSVDVEMGGAAGISLQQQQEHDHDDDESEWATDEEPQLVDERCMF